MVDRNHSRMIGQTKNKTTMGQPGVIDGHLLGGLECCPAVPFPDLNRLTTITYPVDSEYPNGRVVEYGYDVVEATLPAVVSVVEKTNEPRYPSFKGIMAAKKKPVQFISRRERG